MRSLDFVSGVAVGAFMIGMVTLSSKKSPLRWYVYKDDHWVLHEHSDIINYVYSDHCVSKTQQYEVYNSLVTFDSSKNVCSIQESDGTTFPLKRE